MLNEVSSARRLIGVDHSVQGTRCLVGVGCGADQCPSAARNDGQHGGRGVGSERGPMPGVAGGVSNNDDTPGQGLACLSSVLYHVDIPQWV